MRTYERPEQTPERIIERTDDEHDTLWFLPDFRLHGEPSQVERWGVGFRPFGDHVVAEFCFRYGSSDFIPGVR